ncbi:hypothetical protein HYPBUDRAFT_152696 [Hyphopichia burtonii NRRL Y-1933]|uniref:Uncharacterized protein n=1 Tax=Hyphopichia burtonii NRRL Y-1933 TaxID=984485 RepID=A0A1E4RLE5_9ASCO|nr:hypothetical protein HYPBUDRAFT_152696 [Hyphopichia burtonii NRRL Y-1933]ODV68021.1 hypothetical protein HYPBUDRAFT_152696 [Hyphopichia burtonii NRRL Y-1933]
MLYPPVGFVPLWAYFLFGLVSFGLISCSDSSPLGLFPVRARSPLGLFPVRTRSPLGLFPFGLPHFGLLDLSRLKSMVQIHLHLIIVSNGFF